MAGSAILSVRITSDAKDAKKGFDDAGKSLDQLDKAAGKAGGGMGKLAAAAKVGFAAVVAGAAAAGAALLKIGADFNKVQAYIRVGTGATGEALEGFMTNVKNIATQVPASIDAIGFAVADLNTALGLTGPELETLSTQFLNLSRITGTDVQANIASVTRAFGDWNIETENMGQALDEFFRASQNTGASVERLSSLVVQFGAPMRAMGFNLTETTALLGLFEKTGVNTELVMGSLRIALVKFAKAGESAPEALRRIITEIKDMEDPTLAAARAMEVFGAKAGADMADTIRGGKFEIEELVDAIANGTDTINQAAADTEGLGEKFQLLKNNVMVAVEPLASALFDLANRGLGQVVEWAQRAQPALAEFGDAARGAFTDIGTRVQEFLAPLGGIEGVLQRLGEAATRHLSLLTTPWRTAVEGAQAFLDKLGGIGEIWDGITRGAQAFHEAFSEAIEDAVTKAGEFLEPLGGVSGALDGIQETADRLSERMVGMFADAGEKANELLEPLGGVSGALDTLGEKAGETLGTVVGMFTDATTAADNFLAPVGGLAGAFEGFKAVAEGALNTVLTLLDTGTGIITTLIEKVGGLGGAAEIAFSMFSTSIKAVFGPLENVIRLAQRILDLLASIRFPSPPSWMSSLNPFGHAPSPDIVGVPRLDGILRFLPPTPLTAAAPPPDVTASAPTPALLTAARPRPARTTIVNNAYNVRVEGAVDQRSTARQISDLMRGESLKTSGLVRSMTP